MSGLYLRVGSRQVSYYGEDVLRENVTPYKASADAYLRKQKIKNIRRKARDRVSIQFLLKKYGSKCQICFQPVNEPTRDHIVPLREGGTNFVDNIQLACAVCNVNKGSHGCEPPHSGEALVEDFIWKCQEVDSCRARWRYKAGVWFRVYLRDLTDVEAYGYDRSSVSYEWMD